MDKHVEAISAEEIQKLSKYYNWSMYQALLHATKYSLNAMKERICGRRSSPKQDLKPFFDVDVRLHDKKCVLSPTLEDIQGSINRAAAHVLKSTSAVENWNQKDIPEDKREPFYDWIAKDKEIVKVILLLTGSIQGTKNQVFVFLDSFNMYNWLWNDSPEDALKQFAASNPKLEDYEERLRKFQSVEEQINEIKDTHKIGALNLKTKNLKDGLIDWVKMWQGAFSKDLHKKAKHLLEKLTDEIKQLRLMLEKPVNNFDTLGTVMIAVDIIRKKQSNIDIDFKPVTEMYEILEYYLKDLEEYKDEFDAKQILEKNWNSLVSLSENTAGQLQGRKDEFKKALIDGIRDLEVEVVDLRESFEKHGPMAPGISPREALDRLQNYKDKWQLTQNKYVSFYAGETLFGLPHQPYPLLE